MTPRHELLASVASTIRDYRAGDVSPPTPDHVDRWVGQFEEPVQLPILSEMDHVLKQSYYSREAVERGLGRLLTFGDLVGSDPLSFWRQATVFRRQGHGTSQRDLVAVLDACLVRRWGFSSAARSDTGESFVYLDDGIFSGERVIQDLEEWIEESAPSTATVHLILVVCHRLGKYWVERRVGNCARKHGKTIEVKFWCSRTIENRKLFSKDSEVLWPTEAPDDAAVQSYRERPGVGEIVWRPPGGQTQIFSSESGRSLLEREFVMAGARLVAKAQSPNPRMRPLGYSRFGFGFGSMTATFRNCPNNAPLVLWWGDPAKPASHPPSLVPAAAPENPSRGVVFRMRNEGSRSSQSIGQTACRGDRRESSSDVRIRHYSRSEAVVFLKTREKFGGLSNMAAGFPLCVNGIEVRTSEALYQACRFPHLPDIQREILEQRSPMTAKMKSKPHRAESRPDWNHARIKVMRWCLRVKLAQNWETFAGLLESTGDRPIVEESRRDDFWGAKPAGDDLLVGMNILGRLLMELRAMARDGGRTAFRSVPPPELANFRLLEEPVETIAGSAALAEPVTVEADSEEDQPWRNTVSSASLETAVVRGPNEWDSESTRNLIARLRSMVGEHPASRPEINAALGPLLPVNLSEAEKKKRISGHLRSLRRGAWIAFDKADRRWKPGNRSALLRPVDVRPGPDPTARHT